MNSDRVWIGLIVSVMIFLLGAYAISKYIELREYEITVHSSIGYYTCYEVPNFGEKAKEQNGP